MAQYLSLAKNHSGISFKPTKVYQKIKARSFNDYRSAPAETEKSVDRDSQSQLRKSFKGRTPTMRDIDVKELVKKYPSNYVNIKQFIKDQKGHFS